MLEKLRGGADRGMPPDESGRMRRKRRRAAGLQRRSGAGGTGRPPWRSRSRAVCGPARRCRPLYTPFPSWSLSEGRRFQNLCAFAAMSVHRCAGGWKRRRGAGASPEIFLSLPVILRAETGKQMERERALLDSGLFSGAQTPSPSGLVWLSGKRLAGKDGFDHRIYIWNRQTWEFWRQDMDTYCAPLELNGRDIRALPSPGPGEKGRKEILVYGRIPMMVTANCIRKTTGRCPKERAGGKGGKAQKTGREDLGRKLFLIDRYQAAFPAVDRLPFLL